MESAPKGTNSDLSSYLQRQLNKLDLSIQNITMQKLTVLPIKPIIGKLYYFNNTIMPTITSEGVWVYKSTGWSYLG